MSDQSSTMELTPAELRHIISRLQDDIRTLSRKLDNSYEYDQNASRAFWFITELRDKLKRTNHQIEDFR
jgi:arsenate reductase-like glutaredoxin family protein